MSTKALQAAFVAATKKVGKELAGAMCVTYGSRDFTPSDVPADRQSSLLAVLNRMASGERVNVAMASAALAGPKPPARKRQATEGERWQDMQDEAGYKAADVKAVPEGTTLADLHAAAYAKWNRKNNA